MRRPTVTAFLIFLALSAAGCFRGIPTDNPPVHPIRDMDDQPKYKPQGAGAFFADSSAMRTPPPGTVAMDELRDDSAYFAGKDARGNFIAMAPVHVTIQLLERGQERFNIFCSPCHSRVGDGKGIVVTRGYTPPPSFQTDRIRNFPDGEIFDVITHGVRTMPSYANQVPVADRWAIIAYIRALQRSQNATINDVPQEMRQKIR